MNDDHDPSVPAARSRVYGLLATVFDGDVDRLAEAMAAGAFAALASTLPGAPDVDALSASDPDAATLSVGHDNLFVVPGPHYVPPFASGHVVESDEGFESDSIHREPDSPGELLGRPAAVAAATYDRFGFTPTVGTEFPDSLAAELAFLGALAAAEADAASPGQRRELRETQLAFLEDQLLWLDAFAAAVADADAVEGVYAELAAFAAAFVDADRTQLAGALDAAQSL